MSSGPVELKFFIYDTPKQNLQAYNKYINGWTLHPFWSMGFHICKYGIHTVQEWKGIWEKAIENDISVEVMWSDIDYLQNYEDFTISHQRYNVTIMKEVANLANKNGVRWIPIIDAGVKMLGPSGFKGTQQGLFIMSQITNSPLIGCVWPGAAHFVDFNHPLSGEFWIQGLNNITEVYNGPQPSGIWLDMNDPSSFTKTDVGQVFKPEDCKNQPDSNDDETVITKLTIFLKKANTVIDNILQKGKWGYPWSPMGIHPLAFKTISTNGLHINGNKGRYFKKNNVNITEYELHNLYGFFEGIDTNEYLKRSGFDLPFVISRSTAAGQGAYTQHWTGDNHASWDQLRTSIGDLFNFQLFGIPMTGADVCGFNGPTNPELCARWYQLGAWYPFFRSHNDIRMPDQYPWSFPNYPYVLESSRAAINNRYQHLKWFYTLFVREQPYGSVFNPLFFNYPDESQAIRESNQFLIGDELMIAPVVHKTDQQNNSTSIKVYFPGKPSLVWYDVQSGRPYYGQKVQNFTVPFNGLAPAFQKAGSIIANQIQFNNTATRTRYMDNKFKLVIALDPENEAKGNLLSLTDYSEQFVKQNCIGEGQNCLLDITANVLIKFGKKYLRISVNPSSQETKFIGEVYVSEAKVIVQPGYKTYNKNVKFAFNSTQRFYETVLE